MQHEVPSRIAETCQVQRAPRYALTTGAIARLHVNAQALHESDFMSVLACLFVYIVVQKQRHKVYAQYESEDALIVDSSSRGLQHMSGLKDCNAVNCVK